MDFPKTLRDRAIYQAFDRTSLLDKLATLTDEEWAELTFRITKHVQRALEERGYVITDPD